MFLFRGDVAACTNPCDAEEGSETHFDDIEDVDVDGVAGGSEDVRGRHRRRRLVPGARRRRRRRAAPDTPVELDEHDIKARGAEEAARILEYDANRDGKISAEEMKDMRADEAMGIQQSVLRDVADRFDSLDEYKSKLVALTVLCVFVLVYRHRLTRHWHRSRLVGRTRSTWTQWMWKCSTVAGSVLHRRLTTSSVRCISARASQAAARRPSPGPARRRRLMYPQLSGSFGLRPSRAIASGVSCAASWRRRRAARSGPT